MPPPVVYVVVGVVAAAAAGVAFKQFVYDPHIKPAVSEWWEGVKARKQARRARRQGLVAPHSYSDDQDMRQRPSGDDGATLVELESLKPMSKSSSVQSAGTSSDIRLRRVRPASDEASEVLDESVDKLSYVPITPVMASPSNRSIAIASPPPPAQHVEQDPFVVGAETPSMVSEHSSPEVHISVLNVSPARSPASMSPRVHLPTPPSEQESSPQRPLSPELASPRSVSPEAPSTRVLSPPVLAPSMSNTHTMSSQLSFVTANSPTTDFHSLSSPSQPNSPFSDSFTFSGDEDVSSFYSHSSVSQIRLTSEFRDTETRDTMSTTEFEEIEDAMSDGSGGSWEDIRSGAVSPRH